jgi:hemerythrin superfamily protein
LQSENLLIDGYAIPEQGRKNNMSLMSAIGLSSDATELLKTDHRGVETMIATLEGYAGKDSETEFPNPVFLQMKEALTLHALAEEQIFYPELKNYPETAELVPEAYEEHQDVKDLLEKMTAVSPSTSEFQHMLTELKNDLTHHVSEEEKDMFVKAKQAMGETRLAEVGRQIQEFKKRENDDLAAAASSM